MSRIVTNHQNGMCVQRRLRSAWASAEWGAEPLFVFLYPIFPLSLSPVLTVQFNLNLNTPTNLLQACYATRYSLWNDKKMQPHACKLQIMNVIKTILFDLSAPVILLILGALNML